MPEAVVIARSTYTLPATVTLTVSGEEAVLLDLANEAIYSLNGTGVRVVELLTAGHDVAAVVAALSAEYAIDGHRLQPEIHALIRALVAANLLRQVEPTASDE